MHEYKRNDNIVTQIKALAEQFDSNAGINPGTDVSTGALEMLALLTVSLGYRHGNPGRDPIMAASSALATVGVQLAALAKVLCCDPGALMAPLREVLSGPRHTEPAPVGGGQN